MGVGFLTVVAFSGSGHIAIPQPVAAIIVQIFDPMGFVARPTHPDFLLTVASSSAAGCAARRAEVPVAAVGPDFGGYARLFRFISLALQTGGGRGNDTPQITRSHSVHGPTFPPALLQGEPRGSVAVSERTHSMDFSRSM
jgi:hypothetical protein